MNTLTRSRPDPAWWALRIFFGAVPIIAGLDKYFNLLTDWRMYLNPILTRTLPLSASAFLHIIGLVEIAAGLLVLTRRNQIGAYIVMIWLVGIAANLVMMGKFYDVAVRDLGLAIGAFTLASLTSLIEQVVPEGTAEINLTSAASA